MTVRRHVVFVRAYPKLGTLIRRCWMMDRDPRPNFEEFVSLTRSCA